MFLGIGSSTQPEKAEVELNGSKNNYGEFIATPLNIHANTSNILSELTTGAYPIPSQPSFTLKNNSNFVPFTDHLLNSSDKYLMSSTGVTAQNEDIDMTPLNDVDKHPSIPIIPPKRSYENVSSSSSSFQSTYSNDFGSKILTDTRETDNTTTTCSYDQNISKMNFDSNVRETQNQPLKHSYNKDKTKLPSNKQNISGDNFDQSSSNYRETSFSNCKGQNLRGFSYAENYLETSKDDNESEYTIKTRYSQKQSFEKLLFTSQLFLA
uniref:Uncharacterized protein n=1 Tax=Meloidogyne floridensis TaxID=298350 RepID=A0A915NVV1_9BILA